jgi:hypothetical protein
MNDDELLTTFREEVAPPDETTARRAYAYATADRRRAPRRRLVLAVALVVAAGAAGGLYASLGGASSNVNPERQQIVDATVAEVQGAFDDRRDFKANLDGSLLTVSATSDGEGDGIVSGFEELVLAYVADDNLRAAGDEGVATITYSDGTSSLSPLSDVSPLEDGACEIPAGTQLANVTAASARLVPLLRGFCVIHLTTADPKTFASDVETTLNQLDAAVPPAKPSQGRAVLIEADDSDGSPVIVGAWGPGTVLGGAVYVRPGLCSPLVFGAPVGGPCG